MSTFQVPDVSHLQGLTSPLIHHMESAAESAYKRIGKMIAAFEADLDDQHEVGLAVVGLPGSATMHVTGYGYWGPDIVRFFGTTPDGGNIELIQNVTQLNQMLISVPKMGEEPIRVVGTEFEEE